MGGHECSEMEAWSGVRGLVTPTQCEILLASGKITAVSQSLEVQIARYLKPVGVVLQSLLT